ncbi:MAG: hypothetical protein LW690_14590 [Opitutaceae bacterium]|nr:hypothetical protein [Opitutaceae bacterium]
MASALCLLLAACATPPGETGAGDGATRGMAEGVERDRVLHACREASAALRAGRHDVAKARLDEAIARIGGLITDDASAARARGLFASEDSKVFIGEPYERVMVYYYRGLLYWRDGEPDNARACFRSGSFIDAGAAEEKHDADYVLLDYLEGLATVKLQGDGAEALARARTHAGERRPLPDYNPSANVLVFAEYGRGPRKYAAGPYGDQLRFHVEDSPSRSARLVLEGGRKVVPLPAYDDLGYQAVTRGRRVMDHILGRKAVFKAGVDAASDVALAGAVIASDEARRREKRGRDGDDAEVAALGLGVLGAIGKVVSAATRPEADIRQWGNLPQRLSFAALRLSPGNHAGRIEFLDQQGQVLTARSRPISFEVAEGGRDTVVILSELTP